MTILPVLLNAATMLHIRQVAGLLVGCISLVKVSSIVVVAPSIHLSVHLHPSEPQITPLHPSLGSRSLTLHSSNPNWSTVSGISTPHRQKVSVHDIRDGEKGKKDDQSELFECLVGDGKLNSGHGAVWSYV